MFQIPFNRMRIHSCELAAMIPWAIVTPVCALPWTWLLVRGVAPHSKFHPNFPISSRAVAPSLLSF